MDGTIDLTVTILINPRKQWFQFWIPVELELDVEATFFYEIENNSIGHYEFWGHKCYDHQPDYLGNVFVEGFDFDKLQLPWYCRNSKAFRDAIEAALENECENNQVRTKIEDSVFSD
jgi:hypothetical protein